MPKIYIDQQGTIEGIYSDAFAGIISQGDSKVTRASHVEPGVDDSNNPCWYADLSPVGGPQLGPFTLRQTALNEEVAWLEKNIFDEVK